MTRRPRSSRRRPCGRHRRGARVDVALVRVAQRLRCRACEVVVAIGQAEAGLIEAGDDVASRRRSPRVGPKPNSAFDARGLQRVIAADSDLASLIFVDRGEQRLDRLEAGLLDRRLVHARAVERAELAQRPDPSSACCAPSRAGRARTRSCDPRSSTKLRIASGLSAAICVFAIQPPHAN